MERRVLLAISLSFLVLFLYQSYLAPPPPANQTAGQPVAPAAAPPEAGGAAAAPNVPPPPPVVVSEAVVGDTEERDIVVETPLVRAVFTNRGARLRHWVLKRYNNERGEPMDLIPETLPPGALSPFALRVDDTAATTRLNETLYRLASPSMTEIEATSDPVTLTFEMETAEGLAAKKTFVLDPASYLVTFSASVSNGGQALNPAVAWGPGLGDDIARTPPSSFFSPNYSYPAQAIYYMDGDVERVRARSMDAGGQVVDGVVDFAGVDDHYFIAAVVKPEGPVHVTYTAMVVPAPDAPSVVGHYMTYDVRFQSAPAGARFFFGPKQFDALQAVDPGFTKAIYFGIFAWLAAPLLLALKWVHGFAGNWGWSIIILTIFINIAMFPLRHKSVASMRRMQAIQPQVKAIQERYAKYKVTDPEKQKMNQEVMDLYKAKGVNPASGCLPMLLTMPFLFAFYSMLSQAIELRGADFGGWITDLSAHDPLFITPLIMGATMFWQQRITPSSADPTQAKVMLIMPFMFTFMFLWAPSGLVIYWLVSNVFTIGQQYFTTYAMEKSAEHHLAAAPAKPAKKKP
ncbi:MAG: membrane protein insertase YidC [Vicinamibacterales bacterium]